MKYSDKSYHNHWSLSTMKFCMWSYQQKIRTAQQNFNPTIYWGQGGKTLGNTGETSCLDCSKVKIRLHTDGRRNALIDIITSWAAHCSWEHGKNNDQPKADMVKGVNTRTLSAEIFQNCGNLWIIEDWLLLFWNENYYSWKFLLKY